MDVNKVILLGRIGTEPELKIAGDSKKSMVRFSVATGHKNRKTKKIATTWHSCVAWEKIAENIAKYITKGRRIYLEGELNNTSWTDKDGIKRYSNNIMVRTITMVDSKKDLSDKGESKKSPADEKEYVDYTNELDE